MSKSDSLVDITAKVRLETEKGIALWDGEEDKNGKEVWHWCSKRLFEQHAEVNADGTITMPEWLATKCELV